jgi:glycosyltransferase involved in cell wall biosynthesis
MRRHYRDVLVANPPDPNLKFCVIVPARNEEELLPSALQALAEQKQLDGSPLPYSSYEVIVLINNSSDLSRQVAEEFQRLYPKLRLYVAERNLDNSHAHAGYVRRLLMDEACRRLENVGAGSLLILSTDSDTRVAPNWIARNSQEIARGAQVVGGRIVVLPCEQDSLDSAAQEIYRYDHVYRRLVCWIEDRWDPEPHDPWPRHHQHFGASLAITPRAYQAARRLPPRRYLEDVSFYDMLVSRDIKIRHSNAVRVFTSGRLNGRTRFGLSRQLSDWQGSRKRLAGIRVESARFLSHLFRTRRQLRRFWLDYRQTQEIAPHVAEESAAALGLPFRQIIQTVQAARYFGALLRDLEFYERCRAMWPEWIRLASLPRAVDELVAAFDADRLRRRRSAEMPAVTAANRF